VRGIRCGIAVRRNFGEHTYEPFDRLAGQPAADVDVTLQKQELATVRTRAQRALRLLGRVIELALVERFASGFQ
jgi:hypothetical protein